MAQVPVGSKAELVIRRKKRISSPPPQISWSQKAEKNLVFQGEVNVNQRQDGNGATGTTEESIASSPRMQWFTVKEFATFAQSVCYEGYLQFFYSLMWSRFCDPFEPI